jgi:hypothetical protein
MYLKKYQRPGIASNSSKAVTIRVPQELIPRWKAAATTAQMTATGLLLQGLIIAIEHIEASTEARATETDSTRAAAQAQQE